MKPIIKLLNKALFCCLLLLSITANAQKKYVIIGYVGGYRGLLDTIIIDAKN